MKVLSQQLIKQTNLKQIYTLVADNEGISRTNIASLTWLSKTTVSTLVEELLDAGFLLDAGAAQTRRQGRKPNSLRVNDEGNVVAVVNWLRSKLQIASVGLGGTVKNFREKMFDPGQDYAAQIADGYRALCAALCADEHKPRVLALCIIVPGIIDPCQKRVFSSVLPVQAGEWVVRRLRAAIPNVPMAMFNDTACYAYAEMSKGFLDDESSIFVNLSGGVGAVMFSGGKMLRCANGMTTQFGHFSVVRDGALCRCGNRGCLERRIGESVLAERAREFMTAGEIEAFGAFTYQTVGRAADEGQPQVCRMADSMAGDLAFALSNFITLYNVRKCVIGGEARLLGNYFFERLQEHITACSFREFVSSCELQYSRLPKHAQFAGAARYFIDVHYRFEENLTGKLFLR
ncbi:ROK family transcriptional regulator [Anaerotruncus colihominis]|uniref:ROK family transcriptional regulator n=1 Tax=Anaerotruncus colihominis TaxID=169435 RepID=UPI003511FF99